MVEHNNIIHNMDLQKHILLIEVIGIEIFMMKQF